MLFTAVGLLGRMGERTNRPKREGARTEMEESIFSTGALLAGGDEHGEEQHDAVDDFLYTL